MTVSILLFGLLLGIKHALEADHVAAVASLASRSSSLRDHITLAPIRSGVGLRLGANIGYLKYTREPTWNPF